LHIHKSSGFGSLRGGESEPICHIMIHELYERIGWRRWRREDRFWGRLFGLFAGFSFCDGLSFCPLCDGLSFCGWNGGGWFPFLRTRRTATLSALTAKAPTALTTWTASLSFGRLRSEFQSVGERENTDKQKK